MGLMADTTPAWREPYGTILDELAYRHTGWWAAEDGLTQIGDDPKRDQYPEEWYQAWIPPFLRGRYDTPGWTADGVEPWGRQIDPIGADGALWLKGNFLIVLGLHKYVTNDDKWNEPFETIRDGENTFTWTYSGVAGHLAKQWSSRPEGCHCENTKIWPI